MPIFNDTLANKEIRIYKALPIRTLIKITPATSATVTVEYTNDSLATVESGNATWSSWPLGQLTTTATVTDWVQSLCHLRVTSSGATCNVYINTDPQADVIEPFTSDWGFSDNRVIYQNISLSQPATLTNPTYQATNAQNNYTQISIQNKSTGVNASADMICYPDNVTSSDLTGFVNIGITSSAYAQAAYAVTVANEAYLFASAPSGASKSGNLVIATDSTGTTNAIKFATGGFNSTANFRAQIDASGLSVTKAGAGLNVKEGANCKQGTATLVAGTVVVSNTSVTANSRIMLTTQSVGGTAGFLVVSARTAGTSFTILSSSGTDTSTVAFQIFEPSV